MKVRKQKKRKDGIWLNPKCQYNGCSCREAPKSLDMENLQQLSLGGSTLQVIGSGKGLPLTGKAEGEEIVFARSERK